MQLSLELERGDRRREANRRQIAEHMGAAGWRGLAVEIVIYAANESPLEAIDGARWLVCRLSERRLAAKLGAGKSGVHEALERLAGGELVERGVGMFRVAWDRVCELEAVASWVPLPAVECEPPARSGLPSTSDPSTSDPSEANSRSVGGRSEGGRKVVGYWNQEQETSSSIHPIQNQEPTRDHTADRRPTADRPPTDRPRGIGFRIRWRDLVTSQRRLNRSGNVRIFRQAVAAGWLEPTVDDFAHQLGLVLFVTDPAARKAAGIDRPISWLVAALQRGPAGFVSWPPDESFVTARSMIDRAGAELLDELGLVEPAGCY